MIQKTKKQTLLLMGMVVTGLIGIVSTGLRSNYSKDNSLFISTVHADYTAYTVADGGGSGCGGCSSGCGASGY